MFQNLQLFSRQNFAFFSTGQTWCSVGLVHEELIQLAYVLLYLTVQLADIPLPQSAILGLHPIVHSSCIIE